MKKMALKGSISPKKKKKKRTTVNQFFFPNLRSVPKAIKCAKTHTLHVSHCISLSRDCTYMSEDEYIKTGDETKGSGTTQASLHQKKLD